MKHTIITGLTLLWCISVAAQETQVVKDKAYYLQKSKNQKTTAWILAGTGTAMIIGGAIGFNQNFEVFGSGGEAEAWIMVAGVPVALASIPFFISAAKNKRRAEAMVGFQWQTIPAYGGMSKKIPGIGITVRLR